MTAGQHERLAAALERQPARAVVCPSCQAPIGRPCKRPSGYTIPGGGVHAPRLTAARLLAHRGGAT